MAPIWTARKTSRVLLPGLCLGLGLSGALVILGTDVLVFKLVPSPGAILTHLLAGTVLGGATLLLLRWRLDLQREFFRQRLRRLNDLPESLHGDDDLENQLNALEERRHLLLTHGRETLGLLDQCTFGLQQLDHPSLIGRDTWSAAPATINRLQQQRQQMVDVLEEVGQAMGRDHEGTLALSTCLRKTRHDITVTRQRGQSALDGLTPPEQDTDEIKAQTEAILSTVQKTCDILDTLENTFTSIQKQALKGADTTSALRIQTEQGTRHLESAVQGTNQAQQQTQRAGEALQRLTERSQEISSSTEVIRELVADTELLAFNAAIIAAKAGEEGQAFAVIAEEIKELAVRTTGSAQEIQRILRDIRRDTDEARDAAEAATHRIDLGQHHTGEALQTLQALKSQTNQALEVFSAILHHTGDSTSPPLAPLEGITTDLERVRAVSRTLQTQAEAINQARQEVAQLVDALVQVEDHLSRPQPIEHDLHEQASLNRKTVHDLRHTLQADQTLASLEDLISHTLEHSQASQRDVRNLRQQLDRQAAALDTYRQQLNELSD